MNRLYVSDLDHTLLDREARLSGATRLGLLKLLDAGVRFTVASARSVASIREVLDGVPVSLPVIEFNGAFVTDLATGAHLVTHAFEGETARGILGLCRASGMEPHLSSFDGERDRCYVPPVRNAGAAFYLRGRLAAGDPRMSQVDDVACALDDEIVCFTVIDAEERLAPLEADLTARFGPAIRTSLAEDVYCRGWCWLMVHPAAADKGRATRWLRQHEGLDGVDLVVFGDQHWDLPLFDVAHHAVAVANAEDEVRARADEVIGPHHEDAVIRWLLSATLGE
jgi:hydroxymethylpyrimidine pyrophosphatase-like HAD family hydrolase